MDCINIRDRFGDRYRIDWEESYCAERGERARADDPWSHVIPCRHGSIYPHGGDTLAVSVDGHPQIATTIRKLPCCTVHQDGDFGELTALFDVDDFEAVAEVMKPRKRRRVSEAERARLADMGRRALEGYRQRNVEGQCSGPESPQTTLPDSEVA